MPRALLLRGGGGVGKTTIAQSIGVLLTSRRHPTCVVDLDAIAQFGPPQPASASGLRFHDQLRVRNLAAVWLTYLDAGAQFLVVSGAEGATHQPIHDFAVSNDRPTAEVATEILESAGWID